MGAFGFDPSIILSGAPALAPNPSLNDTLETLGRLGQYKAQQQQHEAQLAGLMRKQEQEQTLRDIYSRYAGNLDAVGPALMQGGQGDAAMDWMKGRAGIESQKAAAQRFGSALYEAGLERLRGRLSVVKTPEQYAQIVAPIPAEERASLGLTDEWDPVAVQGFLAGGKAGEKAKTPEELDAMLARADKERAQAERLRRGPTPAAVKPMDPLKQRDIESRIAERERKAAEAAQKTADAGQPDPLLAVEGYHPRPGFKVKPEVAEKMRVAQGETRTMTETVDEIMKLYQQYGNTVLPSTVRARMGSLATGLQLAAKGPTMYALGVIAGPDMGLLNTVISDPTKKEATIADFFSGGGDASETMERFKVFREQVGKKLHNAITTRGYDPDEPKKKGSATGGSPALNPGEVLMVDPKGRRHAVAEKDVAAAEEHKWKRAKTGDINL